MLRESILRTSERVITSPREESSGWTVRAAPPSSTASCTSSLTTGTGLVVGLLKILLKCLFRFGELKMDYRSPAGYDRTRNAVIGHKDFDLTYLDEAYTSEHWLVRIYR